VAWVVVQLLRPVPSMALTASVTTARVLPGAPPRPDWPGQAEAAVGLPGTGLLGTDGGSQPVPIASLAKIMTAYVVLGDHPLPAGGSGPTITATAADAAAYASDQRQGQSVVRVVPGEKLTERQALEALLIPSGNNIGAMLAGWDAGSEGAFVAEMNADASRLGMDQSHFADASGVDPASMSTADDLLKVAAHDMADPAFASMVTMTSVTLPVAGTISTYTPLLGLQGVIGVKSGFTSAAGGCDVLAVMRTVHGRSVLLLAAVTGQTGPEVLAQAGLHALALVDAVGPLIGDTPVLRSGQVVARVSEGGRAVDAQAAATASVLTWPGVTATRRFQPLHHLTDQASRGARAGTVVVTLGTQHVVVPVRLEQDVPRESLLQRLF